MVNHCFMNLIKVICKKRKVSFQLERTFEIENFFTRKLNLALQKLNQFTLDSLRCPTRKGYSTDTVHVDKICVSYFFLEHYHFFTHVMKVDSILINITKKPFKDPIVHTYQLVFVIS